MQAPKQNPVIIAAIRAALAAAKASRTAGGIAGAGGKNVDKIYKPMSEAQSARNLKAVEEIRKQLGAKKPTAEEVTKRLKTEKLRDMERIRKQGRN
jgi:hypothetical protein